MAALASTKACASVSPSAAAAVAAIRERTSGTASCCSLWNIEHSSAGCCSVSIREWRDASRSSLLPKKQPIETAHQSDDTTDLAHGQQDAFRVDTGIGAGIVLQEQPRAWDSEKRIDRSSVARQAHRMDLDAIDAAATGFSRPDDLLDGIVELWFAHLAQPLRQLTGGAARGVGLRRLGVVDHFEVRDVPGCNQSKRSEENTSELQSRGHLVCRLP